MQAEITTIPQLLIKHYGNMTAVARELGVYRSTVRKFARDLSGDEHLVSNGQLFTMCRQRGTSGNGL